MLLPAFEVDRVQGLAMRQAWGWGLAMWDIVGALVAVYYWTLRRSYRSLMEGAQLFEDLQQRERRALELNDNVLQGLVVAKMALDLDETQRARAALDTSIRSASHMITDLLGSGQRPVSEGLLRRTAAVLAPHTQTVDGPPDAPAAAPDESRGPLSWVRPRWRPPC